MTAAHILRRQRSSIPARRRKAKAPSFAVASAVVIGALTTLALLNRHLAKKAERDNPAAGRFLNVNGVRLHYVERGSGEALILLHGNGSMIQDFEFERSHRSRCQALPCDCYRPAWLRPQ